MKARVQKRRNARQVGALVLEAKRATLRPNDVLVVNIQSDDCGAEMIAKIQHHLEHALCHRHVKVLVFGHGTDEKIEVSVIERPEVANG